MTHQELTDLLPTEFMWGDSLQPHHLQEILQAATAKADARIKELEVLLPPKLTETLTHERNCPAWHNAFGLEIDAEICTCGYKWRVYLQTEQQMHNAWRKRAEEAEIKIKAELANSAKRNPTMSDLLNRLRVNYSLQHEAADRIEQLEAELAALKSQSQE